MIPKHINKGDTVAIVSLSRGLLGMPFIKHELDLGIKRLEEMGLKVKIMPNSLKDMDYLENHPEERASDLKTALLDPEVKMIITAIGGLDTHKTFDYLMNDEVFIDAVKNSTKIFTGFSDTTNNHIMLNKLGMNTFYGPCFLVDLAELDKDMLPYTKDYFMKFFNEIDSLEIKSSDIWYEDRESYDPSVIGTPRVSHKEEHGFETINGSGVRRGRLWGGCIESLYDLISGYRFLEKPELLEKYDLLPHDFENKILFLETSEEKMKPSVLEEALNLFKEKGILSKVQGILVGKPIDEKYYEEYKSVWNRVMNGLDTPVLFNCNFGHSVPRCILPYNGLTEVDFDNKTINVIERVLD